MVDRENRRKAAKLLEKLLDNRINNEEFEEAYCEIIFSSQKKSAVDPAISAIFSLTQLFLNGYITHKLIDEYRLPEETKKDIERWILFLYSDFEYQWDVKSFNYNFIDIILNILTFGIWLKIIRKKYYKRLYDKINWEIWPFKSKEELKKIKENLRCSNVSPKIAKIE